MPVWTGGAGDGHRLAFAFQPTEEAFVIPGLFIQFSIKTHAGRHKDPSAWPTSL